MTKKTDSSVAEPAPQAALSAALSPATGPTPDNTPVPGGGRWRWDEEAKGWVSNDPQPDPEIKE